VFGYEILVSKEYGNMNTIARKIAIFSASVLFAVGLLLSLTVHSSSLRPADVQDSSDAAKLFDAHCDKCHGKDGRAKTMRGKMVGAQDLTDVKWQESVTDEKIAEAIRKGPDAMPSFEKKLSSAQIDALVAYVRHFKGTQPAKKP
jgi:mono/diheme cytochrome c family protein